MIPRALQARIESRLFQGKVIVVYGARQTGKTTLVREIRSRFPGESRYLNCDEPDIRTAFSGKTSTEMKAFLGSARLVVLDEAQRLADIGLVLKLLVDTYPEVQLIATGSSSFELAGGIVEPLTGRKHEFLLFPFSHAELAGTADPLERQRMLDQRLVYGMYPDVVLAGGHERGEILQNLARSYLYKDILAWQRIRHPDALERLLQALALQVGNEVAYPELARAVGLDRKTVESYLDILEKAFIVFRLNPFSRNLRNELKKMRKVYFWDTGMRNALIRNFNPPELRTDAGALWENFLIAERLKQNANSGRAPRCHFWRDHQGREIDYLEEEGGVLRAYGIKYGRAKAVIPRAFLEAYPGSRALVVDRPASLDFIEGRV